MDWLDQNTAPPEFQKYAWIANLSSLAQGLGWAIYYILQTRMSLRDKTYSQAIFPLCANMAWEFVYIFIYPPKGWAPRIVIGSWFFLGLGVMYSAIQSSPREWGHAPLVQRYLTLIFFVMFLYFVTLHTAFAATFGAHVAGSWSAMFCHAFLLIGSLGQLLVREDSRGVSYPMWLGRFLGSIGGIPAHLLRCWYWPEITPSLRSPFVISHVATSLLGEIIYGVLLWSFRQKESRIMKKIA
ncbi:fumitremorgin C monooxygenase [Penicillium longicatenatum]|nr:fumitremorgin C monooxygenase [Penicillium longicatenatum]